MAVAKFYCKDYLDTYQVRVVCYDVNMSICKVPIMRSLPSIIFPNFISSKTQIINALFIINDMMYVVLSYKHNLSKKDSHSLLLQTFGKIFELHKLCMYILMYTSLRKVFGQIESRILQSSRTTDFKRLPFLQPAFKP